MFVPNLCGHLRQENIVPLHGLNFPLISSTLLLGRPLLLLSDPRILPFLESLLGLSFLETLLFLRGLPRGRFVELSDDDELNKAETDLDDDNVSVLLDFESD